MDDYWFKQKLDKPLYSDLIWSKPENRAHAGKLLIIGGSTNGFAHTVGCFLAAQAAGAGSVKVLIPNSTEKLIGHISEDIIFGASTKSGGFSQAALGELIDASDWADTVLLAGELGNNSDTTILFEKYLDKYSDSLIIAGDAFEFCHSFFDKLLRNHGVTFILDLTKLQKLSIAAGTTKPITSKISLVNLVEALHEMTEKNNANIVIEFNEFLIVASQGYVSSTNIVSKDKLQIKMTANASVWFMQNRTKVFEALTCSAITSQE
jgi:hypothetical protein